MYIHIFIFCWTMWFMRSWVKSMLAVVKLLNPIHWTVREFPKIILKIKNKHFSKYLLEIYQ